MRYLLPLFSTVFLVLTACDGGGQPQLPPPIPPKQVEEVRTVKEPSPVKKTAGTSIVDVIDGDTVKVEFPDGSIETVRIIGIDTPETVHPTKPVECFGKEAGRKMNDLVFGKEVSLETHAADDRDRYRRLLRYIRIGKTDIGATMIREGYAYSYKEYPHPRLDQYNALEQEARSAQRGLWGDICNPKEESTENEAPPKVVPIEEPKRSEEKSCVIKGNISKEKIYHLPGCKSYNDTRIDENTGERWFCTEQEALAAGWRKAKNCP